MVSDRRTIAITLAITLVAAAVLLGTVHLILWMLGLHSARVVWFGYVWPSVKGNGPEDLLMTVALAMVTALLYPPVRRWLKKEADALHDHLDGIHDAGKNERAELLRWVQHIAKYHPDIPSELDPQDD